MLNLTSVKQRLEPLHKPFCSAHFSAQESVQSVPAAVLAAMNETERANLWHSQVRHHVSKEVESVDGVSVTALDFFSILVGSDLLVRFKFVGNGKPANVSTHQQQLLADQKYTEEAMAVLSLGGAQNPPTLVTCGYTLEGLNIERVLIRRDRSGHQPWAYDIYGGSAVVEPAVFDGIEEAKPAVVRSKRVTKRSAVEAN